MGSKSMFLIISFLFFIFLSCSPKASDISTTPAYTTITRPSEDIRPAWQVEWDRLVEAARKEGKVVVYTTAGGNVRTALGKGLKDRYGIDLEFVTGRGAELAQKILFERQAGLYLADAYMAGATTTVNVLKPAGVIARMEEALILPEVIDGKLWLGGSLRFLDKDHTIFSPRASAGLNLTTNNTLVKDGEIKSYRDLLNPKWKRNIVMQDPTTAGTTQTGLAQLGYRIMGWDFVRELARQEPILLRNDRLLVEWIAKARYPIGYELKSEIVKEFIVAGAPLKYFNPEEGTVMGSGSAYFSLTTRPNHPNAARVFNNWLLSREGQLIYSLTNLTASARLDVPTGHLPPEALSSPKDKYYPEEEEFYLRKPEFDKILQEIFRPLVPR